MLKMLRPLIPLGCRVIDHFMEYRTQGVWSFHWKAWETQPIFAISVQQRRCHLLPQGHLDIFFNPSYRETSSLISLLKQWYGGSGEYCMWPPSYHTDQSGESSSLESLWRTVTRCFFEVPCNADIVELENEHEKTLVKTKQIYREHIAVWPVSSLWSIVYKVGRSHCRRGMLNSRWKRESAPSGAQWKRNRIERVWRISLVQHIFLWSPLCRLYVPCTQGDSSNRWLLMKGNSGVSEAHQLFMVLWRNNQLWTEGCIGMGSRGLYGVNQLGVTNPSQLSRQYQVRISGP